MPRSHVVAAAVLALGTVFGAFPSLAQSTATGGTSASGRQAQESGAEKPSATRAARTRREPTASQKAARERQRKCGVEWKEAKAANRTGSMKWPQFWSRCNARLKGNSA